VGGTEDWLPKAPPTVPSIEPKFTAGTEERFSCDTWGFKPRSTTPLLPTLMPDTPKPRVSPPVLPAVLPVAPDWCTPDSDPMPRGAAPEPEDSTLSLCCVSTIDDIIFCWFCNR
ncbi:unnamed protein product, partial [Ectocarpus sp. 13 AM-2016]